LDNIVPSFVLATHNRGKQQEFARLFEPHGLHWTLPQTLNIPDVAETGFTFVENAIIKARHVASHSGKPALSDDSGLVIDALNGEPGIYSARYAGDHVSPQAHIAKILSNLHGVPDEKRTARFVSVLVFMQHEHDPLPLICQGIWEGKILTQPIGEHGFGYDPIFWVPTHQCSAAQLPSDLKNQLSHRGRAYAQLMHQLRLA